MKMPFTSWKWPLSSPLRQSLLRLRLKYTARPVRTVSSKASRFIHASMSTSPVSASWATAGIRPPALSKSNICLPSRSKIVGVAWAVLGKRPADVRVVEEDEAPDRGDHDERPSDIRDDCHARAEPRPIVIAPVPHRGH